MADYGSLIDRMHADPSTGVSVRGHNSREKAKRDKLNALFSNVMSGNYGESANRAAGQATIDEIHSREHAQEGLDISNKRGAVAGAEATASRVAGSSGSSVTPWGAVYNPATYEMNAEGTKLVKKAGIPRIPGIPQSASRPTMYAQPPADVQPSADAQATQVVQGGLDMRGTGTGGRPSPVDGLLFPSRDEPLPDEPAPGAGRVPPGPGQPSDPSGGQLEFKPTGNAAQWRPFGASEKNRRNWVEYREQRDEWEAKKFGGNIIGPLGQRQELKPFSGDPFEQSRELMPPGGDAGKRAWFEVHGEGAPPPDDGKYAGRPGFDDEGYPLRDTVHGMHLKPQEGMPSGRPLTRNELDKYTDLTDEEKDEIFNEGELGRPGQPGYGYGESRNVVEMEMADPQNPLNLTPQQMVELRLSDATDPSIVEPAAHLGLLQRIRAKRQQNQQRRQQRRG